MKAKVQINSPEIEDLMTIMANLKAAASEIIAATEAVSAAIEERAADMTVEQNASDRPALLAELEALRARVREKNPQIDSEEKAEEAARALTGDQAEITAEGALVAKDKTARAPVRERAGTHLTRGHTTPIKAGGVIHGLLDTKQHIYQGGGEARNFIYRKRDWITLDQRVWEQIVGPAEYIEMVDNTSNTVYRIAVRHFAGRLFTYNAGGHDRVGVPIWHWKHLDRDGVILAQGDDPHEAQPVPTGN